MTAYHVIRDAQIVDDFRSGRAEQAREELSAHFARLGLADRGIDGVQVTPDLPEQYGFLIDKSSRPRLRPATLPALLDLCARLRLIGGNRPILLKNPWDVLAFTFITRSFPKAKLIFLHRHPLNVMNSQLAATRSLLASRNAYVAMLSQWYRELFDHPLQLWLARTMSGALGPRVVGRHVLKATRYYLDHIAAIPRENYIEVRYEDLCQNPADTIERILGFLSIALPSDARMDTLLNPRRPKVMPEILTHYQQIRRSIAPYCSRHGYDLEGTA